MHFGHWLQGILAQLQNGSGGRGNSRRRRPALLPAQVEALEERAMLSTVYASDDSAMGMHDQPITMAAPGVLGNDSAYGTYDANMNYTPPGPLSAVLVSGPAHGTVTLNGDGSYTYQPATHYVGADSFTYQATAGGDSSTAATVSLYVSNSVPYANDGSYFTTRNQSLTVSAPGLVPYAVDIEGDPVTAVVVTSTSHGSLSLSSDGSFTYSPNTDYVGSDSFTYKLSDGIDESNTATVSLFVMDDTPPTPTPPTPTPPTPYEAIQGPPVDDLFPETTINQSMTIDVLANDYVVDPAIAAGASAVVDVTSSSSSGDSGYDLAFADGTSYALYATQDSWAGTLGTEYTWTLSNLPFAGLQDGATEAIATWGGPSSGSENQFSLFKNGTLVATASHVIYQTVNGKVLGSPNFKLESNSLDVTLVGSGGTSLEAGIPPSSHLYIKFALVDGLHDEGDPAPSLHGSGELQLSSDDHSGLDIYSWQTDSNTHGTVTWNDDHTKLVYTPDADYFWDEDSGEPMAQFTYQIAMAGNVIQQAAVVLVQVNAPQRPKAGYDYVTMNEDNGSVSIDVLTNDTAGVGRQFPEDPIIRIVSQPPHGAATIIRGEPNTIVYTPDPSFAGLDSFRYEIINDLGFAAIGLVEIQVMPVNDPPEFLFESYAFDLADDAKSGTVVGVVRAVDPEGKAVTHSILQGNNNWNEWLRIEPASGFLILKSDLSDSVPLTTTLTVRAEDPTQAGTNIQVTLTKKLLNSDEAPFIQQKLNERFYVWEPLAGSTTLSVGDDKTAVEDLTITVSSTGTAGLIETFTATKNSASNTITINYQRAARVTGTIAFTIRVTDSAGHQTVRVHSIDIVVPNIDWAFVQQNEARRNDFYVVEYRDQTTNELVPDPNSGVTVATGYDIGEHSVAEINQLAIDESLKAKLRPFAGLNGVAAKNKLAEVQPANLTDAEVNALNDAAHFVYMKALVDRYDPAAAANGLEGLWSVPGAAATVIFDRFWLMGADGSTTNSPRWWGYVTQRRWRRASYELRHWLGVPNEEAQMRPGVRNRLNAEAERMDQAVEVP